jgi:hypothetical protein
MAAPILYGWYRLWKEKCPSWKVHEKIFAAAEFSGVSAKISETPEK